MPFPPGPPCCSCWEMSSTGIRNKTIRRWFPFLLHTTGAALTL